MTNKTRFNVLVSSVNENMVSVPLNNTNSSGKATNLSEPENTSVESKSGIVQENATTKFIDDATVTVRDESMVAHVDNTIIGLSDTQMTPQSIIDFLRKPIVISTGVFSTTDTFSFLNSYTMPYGAFISSQGVLWTQKLAGYFGIRMDMRFRIVVNANRMQQGRYMIGWVPLAGAAHTTSSLKNIVISNMHLGTLVQRTTVPHVELDLSTGTSAELLVPFVSVHNFYPLNSILSGTDVASLGYVNVYPYSPLVSPAGSTTAGYTLYLSFENVTLYGAAAAQSGLQDKEVSNKVNGPISSVATSIARGFAEFSNIPLLSSYATPISWVADRIAKSAKIFGFSKPTSGDSNTKMQLVNCPAHNTIDGDSDAKTLSYLSKPGVVNLDGQSGTHFDEMDFAYIARKPAWFLTLQWPESAVVGNLTTISVGATTNIVSLGGALHMPPVAFVGSFFQQWRGSLRYKFKFVKTEFHSGRIQFSFYPTDESTYVGGPEYVNRMIVDIRETTEVELVIPYISRYPWTWTGHQIGLISIDIVDVLVAPAIVSNNISILCEIAGGDDMEFSIPGNFDYTPTLFTPQSGLGTGDRKILTATIGNSVVNSNPTIFSSTCIGDKVSNFRAYLKRFHPINPNDKTTASTVNPNSYMFAMFPDVMIATSQSPLTYQWNADVLSVVGSCYALWRGGIRVRDVIDIGMLPQNTSLFTCVNTGYTTFQNTGMVVNTPISYNTSEVEYSANMHQTFQNLEQNNVITVEVPQYTQTLCRAKADVINFQGSATMYGYNNTAGSSNNQGYVSLALPSNLTTTPPANAGYSVHNVFRALADDGSFSCFISVPPLLANTVNGGRKGLY